MKKHIIVSMSLAGLTCLGSLHGANPPQPLYTKALTKINLSPVVKIIFEEQAQISPTVRVTVTKKKSPVDENDGDHQSFHLLSSASQIIFSLENASSLLDIEQFLQKCKDASLGKPATNIGFWTTEKKLKAFTNPCTINDALAIEVVIAGNLSKDIIERVVTDTFSGLSFAAKAEEQKIYTFYDTQNQMSVFSLDFINKKFPLLTYQDLAKYWFNGVVQKYLYKKLEGEMSKLKAVILTKQVDSSLPDFYVGITISCAENNSLEAIGSVLLTLEEVKKQGIAAKELSPIIEFFQENLKSRETMHAFYENGFGLTYSDFIRDSQSILANLSPQELGGYMLNLLKEENFEITLTSPSEQPVSKEEVLETLEQMKNIIAVSYVSPFSKGSKGSGKGKTSIPIPVEGNPTDLFLKLPLKDGEKKNIISIIETIAESNVFQLALKEQEVSQKGDKVNHVHPLRFLGVVFIDPKLKSGMNEIKKNYFKWNGFIGGFSKRIEEEYQRDNLMRYIPGFAAYLNVDQEQIKKYLNSQDWDGFVRFLMN